MNLYFSRGFKYILCGFRKREAEEEEKEVAVQVDKVVKEVAIKEAKKVRL